MTHFKLETLFLSLTIYLIVYANALRKSSRDVSHLGYLYDRPTHGFEIPEVEKGVSEDVEDSHGKDNHRRLMDKYLPPRSDNFSHNILEGGEGLESKEHEESHGHFLGGRGGGEKSKRNPSRERKISGRSSRYRGRFTEREV